MTRAVFRRLRFPLAGAVVLVAMVLAWPRLTAEYYYLRIVTSESSDTYVTYFTRLEYMGSPSAVPALQRLLKNEDPLTRATAARRLARYSSDSTIERLLEATGDPESQVRIAAITSLGEVGDVRAIGPLEDFQRRNTVESDYARDALHRLAERGVRR